MRVRRPAVIAQKGGQDRTVDVADLLLDRVLHGVDQQVRDPSDIAAAVMVNAKGDVGRSDVAAIVERHLRRTHPMKAAALAGFG